MNRNAVNPTHDLIQTTQIALPPTSITHLRNVITAIALIALWLLGTGKAHADELQTLDEAPPGLIEETVTADLGSVVDSETPDGLDNVTSLSIDQGCNRDLPLGEQVTIRLSVAQTDYYRLVIHKPDGSRAYPMGGQYFYRLHAHDSWGRDVKYRFEGELGMPLGQRVAHLERYNGRYSAPSVLAQCGYSVVDASGATRFGQEIRVSGPTSLPLCLAERGNEAIAEVCNGSSRQLWEVERLHFDHYAVRTADIPWEQRCLEVRNGGLQLQACNGGQEVRFEGSSNSWRRMLDVEGQFEVHIDNNLRFTTCWTGDLGFCMTGPAGFYFQ